MFFSCSDISLGENSSSIIVLLELLCDDCLGKNVYWLFEAGLVSPTETTGTDLVEHRDLALPSLVTTLCRLLAPRQPRGQRRTSAKPFSCVDLGR